jgi:hypothetical protein
MKIRTPLFALITAVALAGCESAPTEPLAAKPTVGRTLLNSGPVANIRLKTKKPFASYMHWEFDAQGSYDPDGDPITYRWTSNCVYIANGYSYSYTANAAWGDTCYIDLYVSDGVNPEAWDRVTVYDTSITY